MRLMWQPTRRLRRKVPEWKACRPYALRRRPGKDRAWWRSLALSSYWRRAIHRRRDWGRNRTEPGTRSIPCRRFPPPFRRCNHRPPTSLQWKRNIKGTTLFFHSQTFVCWNSIWILPVMVKMPTKRPMLRPANMTSSSDSPPLPFFLAAQMPTNKMSR